MRVAEPPWTAINHIALPRDGRTIRDRWKVHAQPPLPFLEAIAERRGASSGAKPQEMPPEPRPRSNDSRYGCDRILRRKIPVVAINDCPILSA